MGEWIDRLIAENTAASHHRQTAGVIPIKPDIPKPADAESITQAMERACSGLPILPSEYRARISNDEAAYISTGRIPMKTARAFAQLFANELARDELHPVNCNMVTCWACRHYSNKQCRKQQNSHENKWHRCGQYQEVNNGN